VIDSPVFWIALAIVIGIVLVRKLRRRTRSVTGTRHGVDVEADLVLACRGDHAVAERLIAHELAQNDTLSRPGAALMALAKLRDDQR